ncbi:MAG: peptidase M23 [Cellvibrionales bacterium]|nr:peptidase M23 [Cellvibrionales bacterium]
MAEQRHAVPFNTPTANSAWRQCWLRHRQIRPSSRLPATLGGLCLCLLVLAFSSMAPFKNGSSLSLIDSSAANANGKTKRETISLSLPAIGSSTSAIKDNHDQLPNSLSERSLAAQANSDLNSQASTNSNADNSNEPLAEAVVAEHQRFAQPIKPGDNLSMVFDRVGLSAREVLNVVNSSTEGKALTRMFPGESLEFVINDDKVLVEVIRRKSLLESIHFTRKDEQAQFTVTTHTRQPDIRVVYRSAKVSDSLSMSAERANISPSTTMNMANIFGGVIDFVLDVRNGDQFTVAYEEHFLDGEKIDEGAIIAAQYVNRGKTYNAYRYTDPDGDIGYYNEDGISMRKAFLRAPLDFTRVSSRFNMRRLHPITNEVKPHRGIDYAAPTGTPIFSTGDGHVIASNYNNANGHYIFIRHGESYVTKYLHLHKRFTKKGQRVKQGQIIGQVGSTGFSTGPHLHYEFLVNGVHRNPSTILKKLPKAKRLKSDFKADFIASITSTQMQLASNSSAFKLASNQ